MDASLLSQNVTASGDVTSSQMGFAQGNAAGSTSQGLQSDDMAKTVADSDKDEDDDQKKTNPSRWRRKSDAWTVILPKQN